MEPFIGQIILAGFNFAPRGYALCQGQLLSIAQNSALFSLLGTTYGGDGITTFALPDLRGRVPMGFGNGPGLTPRVLGEESGTETVTLLVSEIPAHNHLLLANSAPGDTGAPAGAVLANSGATDREYLSTGAPNEPMSVQAIGMTGGTLPHNNMQPYLVLNYSIALEGIFPSRN